MDLIDVTIVNVALPAIQRDLGAGYAAGQWAVAGYALAYALLLVTGGRLGDIAGRRRVFLAGVAGFTLASALAGAAWSPGTLVAARILQGAFAGVMVPQAISVITVQFAPGRERAAAFSLYGVLLGVAQVSGPVLGGLLTTHGGWRSIFYINIPIGLLALAGAARWMDDSRADPPPRLDLGGVALISGVVLLLAFPLVQGRELGWPGWSLAMLGCAVPLLAAFARYEMRRGDDALIPTGLFRRRSFSAGLALNLVLFSGIGALFITLTWGLQFGLDWSPLLVAFVCLAWPAGTACTAQLTHRYGHRRGRLLVGLGTALAALGAAWLSAVTARSGADLTPWSVVPCLALSGLGLGLTLPMLSQTVLGEVRADSAGAASGVLNSVTQLGGAIGVALAGVVYFGGPAGSALPRALGYSAAAFLLAAALARFLPRTAVPAEPHRPLVGA
ncbi:MFS transporter [Actinomadura craniellae]|uniref:MFS transporter n=2 Tax=Actinomadura craniellae TaxID=2231787 RepID=A0A365HAF1_9ACTN|nr:MFS transporter [Actinomadura craniellae]